MVLKDRVMKAKVLSAGVVVVRKNTNGYKYLLLRAYSHWDFPKGMVEAGEEPLEAAKREVKEETTITDLAFKWGYDYRETGPYGQGKVARYYLAETRQEAIELPINPELGRPEHEEYRWVSYEEALPMISPRVRSILEWAQNILKYED